MRYLSSISLALIVLMALACTAEPATLATPAPTSDISATVEAQVHATVTAMQTPVVTETPTATPTPTFAPTIEPTPTFVPTIGPTPNRHTSRTNPSRHKKIRTPEFLGEEVGVDEAIPIPATKTPVPTPTPNKGSWISTSFTDAINDTKTTIAILSARQGKSIFGEKFELILRCKNKQIEIYIDWESFIGMDSALVTTRLDDKAATTTGWSISTNYTSTFYPGRDAQYLQALMNANQLVARVTPYSENTVTATFDLTGIRVAGTEILIACQG
jgi:type VI secretion system protein VasI